MLTPQEFSKKRHERDMQELQLRQMAIDQQRKSKEQNAKMAQLARQQQQAGIHGQQQGMANGVPGQQRPGSSSNPASQQGQRPDGHPAQQAMMNGQMQQGGRPQMPAGQRSGHLAVPQMNGQGIPQAQMRPNGAMPSAQDMQRMAHANAQRTAGYAGQQQYPMHSPGGSSMTPQQQMAHNQAMLNNLQQQMNGQTPQMPGQQISGSPSMPPPPTPQQQQGHPQQLSSGHVPALMSIKAQIRKQFPASTEEQIAQMATEMLKTQSQSSSQARQSAMNAAAGLSGGVAPTSQHNMQAYAHNQALYQNNAASMNQLPTNSSGNYTDMSTPQQGQQQQQPSSSSPVQTAQTYANMMRQRTQAQFQQLRHIPQGSPQGAHANLNGSPGVAHATPASPAMQYGGMNMQQQGQVQRPGSRGAGTPGQMQRLGSSGSGVGGAGAVGSPGQMVGAGESPRLAAGVQAGGSR